MQDKKVPNHVAIICDGNRRWARERGLPDFEGHRIGFKNAREKLPDIVQELGIKYVTLWVFSTENWNRSEKEVGYLMSLFVTFSREMLKICKEKKMRFHHIGRLSDLPAKVRKSLAMLEEKTREYEECHFTLALNHGGRDEVVRAVQKIVEKEVKADDVTEKLITSFLDSADIPLPDLIVRTSGELRLSGFMMWEAVYAELYFPNCYFPDFDGEEFRKAVESYGKRERRFGGDNRQRIADSG